MRRALLILLVLGAGAAAAWYFFLRMPPGAPPALAAQVSAEHTLMFSSVEQPDALADAVFKVIETEPPFAAQLPDVTASNAAVAVGFDPSTAAGWQSAGVDPVTGVAVVLDARAGDVPYALLKITDEPKFLAWVSGRVGATATIADGQLSAGNKPKLAVARRGAFTLIADRIPLAVLQTIAQDAGPRLVEAEGFDAAFAQTSPGGRLMGFVPIKNLKKAEAFSGGVAAQTVDFYAALFPALGGQMTAESVRVRVATTEMGLGALRQLYAPRRAAPKFSKWLPAKGFALVRVSVNLFEVFAGIQALLPPAVPAQMRTQLGFAKMALSMVGLDWSLLSQAFTGHVAVAVRPAEGRNPDVLALFALGTPASADKIIESLQAKASKLLAGGPKVPIEELTVAGLAAKRVTLGADSVVIVRSDAMLIVATSAALAEEAITRSTGVGGLSGRPATMFDGDVVLAVHARPAEMLPVDPQDPMHAVIAAAPPIEATIALDKHGMVLEAQTRGMLIMALAGRASFGKARRSDFDQPREAVPAERPDAARQR